MVLLCNEDESLVMKKLTATSLVSHQPDWRMSLRTEQPLLKLSIESILQSTKRSWEGFFFLKRLQSNTSQDYEMSPKKYDSKSLLHISCVFLNFAWPPRRRHVRLIQINFPNRVLIQNNFPPVWAPWAHCGGQVGSFCMKWLVGWST